MIRIAPPEDWAPLDRAVQAVDEYAWIVFTSANAVDEFMQRLYRGGDVRALKGVSLCAVGPSTRDRLLRYGVRADLVPADFRAEGVVDALESAGPLKGRKFLLPMADVGRELLSQALSDAGAQVARSWPIGRCRPRSIRSTTLISIDAARSADRRGHVHERRQRPQLRAHLRRRAGRGFAPADRGRGVRTGDSGGRNAAGHPRHRHAVGIHDRRAGPGAADHYAVKATAST